MKAADIMTRDVVTISSEATITQAAKLMQSRNVRALIVERICPEDAYGIITQADIAKAIANSQNPQVTSVGRVMTKPCIVVNPDLAIEHIAKLFARARIRTAPVIKDELIGIVSLTDVLTKTNCLTSTECLTFIEEEFIPQTAGLADFLKEEREWSEDNSLYENWCSG